MGRSKLGEGLWLKGYLCSKGARSMSEMPAHDLRGVLYLVRFIENLHGPRIKSTLQWILKALEPGEAAVNSTPHQGDLESSTVSRMNCAHSLHPWKCVRS